MGLGRHGGGADLHAVYDRFDVEIRLPTVPERAYESIIHLQTNVLFGQLIRIPAALLAALIVIPYWQYPNDTGGVWFASHKGRRMAAIAVMAALFVTPVCIVVDEIAMDSVSWMRDLPPIVAQGILPVGLIMAGILVSNHVV